MKPPSRIYHYDDHEIRVFVLPPFVVDNAFRAKYEVRASRREDAAPRSGIIAGPFPSADSAEEAAITAAKMMIDRERRTPDY